MWAEARNQRHAGSACALLGVTVLGLALGVPAARSGPFDLPQSGAITLGHFRTQSQGEGGSRWELAGDHAVIRAGVYALENVVLVLFSEGGQSITIRSPNCTYRQGSGVIESDAPVHVEGRELTIDGVGYDVLLTERRLRIRDRTAMTVMSQGGKALLPGRGNEPLHPARDPDGNGALPR
ncbi:MAG: LPS export ABC transporter periplasmic protein LptC [Lentisphaeria bacterium]|nr:LPS export ABC transporter periplasmic protein LptC [Lentisphaeria bacterium]